MAWNKNTPSLQSFTQKKINLIIIYTAADLSMYKSRKSRLKLSGTLLFLKKQLKPLWVNWPKMIGVIWQKFRFFNSAWMLEVALLLSATLTVANLSLQIQWFPFLYHLYCSYELKMIFLKTYFKTQKRCLRTKLLVTVYSKHLQQISVHVSTDIHRSWTQRGKSSPFTRHPITSKTIRQGEKKIK